MPLATNERFISYPCLFDSFTLNHLRSVKLSQALKKMMIIPGGSVDTMTIAEAMRDPTVDLTSGDLGAVLTAVSPITGLAISTLATIQFQQRLDGGALMGASSHATLTAPKGFLYVEEISAKQDAEEGAEIKLKFHCLRVGTNNPFTIAVGQSLTGSVLVNGLYRLSSVTYEGTKVRGVQSVGFKSGIECGVKRDGGAICADVSSITKRQPSIEISGTNMTLPSLIGCGLQAISTGLVIYFEKIGASGANHVSITVPAGTYLFEGVDQSGNNDADVKVSIDLAGASLSYSTTATLP